MKKKLSQVLPSIHTNKAWRKKIRTLFFFTAISLFAITSFALLSIPTGNNNSFNLKKIVAVNSNHNILIQAEEPDKREVKLLFVGDIMLARSLGVSILNGNNPFVNVKSFFSNYDIVIGNLETTIARSFVGVQASKGFTFKAPPKAAEILKDAGIDIVSLANNHSMDYGDDALYETMNYLNSSGVGHFGAGVDVAQAYMPFYIQFKDTKISILGLNNVERWIADVNQFQGGSAYFDETLVRKALKDAQDNSDIVIVMPHWGDEYTSLVNSEQKTWGKFFIDNGADLVIGGHTHSIQANEIYNDKTIIYSLGNFVFDGMTGIPGATQGKMIEVKISNNKIDNTKDYLVNIGFDGFPTLAE